MDYKRVKGPGSIQVLLFNHNNRQCQNEGRTHKGHAKEMRNYILEDFGVFNRSVKPSNEI